MKSIIMHIALSILSSRFKIIGYGVNNGSACPVSGDLWFFKIFYGDKIK